MPLNHSLSPGNIAQTVYSTDQDAIRVTLIGSGDITNPNVTRLSDGTGFISSTVVGADRALDVNIVNAVELTVSHIDDSIRLGDGTNYLTSTTGGGKVALDVNVSSGSLNGSFKQEPSGNTVTTYDFDTVASGATSIVTQYTVPVGNAVYIQKIYLSGENLGKWTIYKNTDILMIIRTTYTDFSRTIELATSSAFGIVTVPGDIIKVEVENVTSSPSLYDATIQSMTSI